MAVPGSGLHAIASEMRAPFYGRGLSVSITFSHLPSPFALHAGVFLKAISGNANNTPPPSSSSLVFAAHLLICLPDPVPTRLDAFAFSELELSTSQGVTIHGFHVIGSVVLCVAASDPCPTRLVGCAWSAV